MIQRIQTVFLALAALLLVFFLTRPEVWNAPETVRAWFTPVVVALAVLSLLGALVAIFLYNDRKRQRKLVVSTQWLVLLLEVAFVAGLYLSNALAGVSGLGYLAVALPLVAYLFLFFARQGIDRDIALVRSMDRLR